MISDITGNEFDITVYMSPSSLFHKTLYHVIDYDVTFAAQI